MTGRATPPPGIGLADHPLPLGAGSPPLPVTWWVPTTTPSALVWLQHGYARNPDYLSTLAGALATSGALVATPALSSFRRTRSLNDLGHLDAIGAGLSSLARGDGGERHDPLARVTDPSTADALRGRLVLVGHSAGGAVLARAARAMLADSAGPKGLVLLDATDNLTRALTSSLPALGDLPVRGVFARPSMCNRNGQGARLLRTHRHGYVGVRLTTGSHCDAEGADTDRLCAAACGRPEPTNVALLYELTVAWARDLARGTPTPAWEPGGERLSAELAAGRVTLL